MGMADIVMRPCDARQDGTKFGGRCKHWIGVGIMIWIGLLIATAVLGLTIWLLPGVFGTAKRSAHSGPRKSKSYSRLAGRILL